MPDAVVIGGGVVGAACAYDLSRRGCSVVLVERDELAAGASGRNQGWFVLSDDPPLRPMSAGSLAMYREVIEGSDVPVRFDPDTVGHLRVATTTAGAEAVRSRVAERQAAGTHAEHLDEVAMRDVEPALSPDLADAWLLDQGRRIDPGALTVALALAARANGADVRTHCTVRDVVHDGARVTGVVTDDGVLHADAVVLAAGPWSSPLARKGGIALPVSGARGWIVELDGTPGLLRHLIEEEARRSRAVLVMEPCLPNGAAKTSRKGCGDFELIVRGVAAHAGLDPAKGASAIHELAHQILAVSELQDLERGITVNAGLVSGGTRPNVTAAEARAAIDVRAVTMADARQVEASIRSLRPVNSRTTLEVAGGFDRPPLERSAAGNRLYQVARDVARDLHRELAEGAAGGGSDGNFTAALGVPTLDGLGPEGGGAHALDEHVVVSDLPFRAALLAGLLGRLALHIDG